MNTSKLKPFDLQAAKAGAKVVTRNNQEVINFAHLPDADEASRVIAVFPPGLGLQFYHEDGRQSVIYDKENDLFMAPVQREAWVNLYADDAGHAYHFPTQEKADKESYDHRLGGKAHKITWEE